MSSAVSVSADRDSEQRLAGGLVRRRSLLWWACILAPAILFAIGAFRAVGHRPLWRDEAATREFAKLSLPDLARAVGHIDLIVAPYYFVVHWFAMLPGYTVSLRIPSVLAAVATVVFIGLAVEERFGLFAGVAASAFLASNASFLETATTARSYAIAGMFLSWAAWSAVRGGRPRTWATLVTAAVLMQLFSVLALPGLAVLAARHHGWRVILKISVVPLFVAGAFAAISHSQSRQVAWIKKISFSELLHTLENGLRVSYLLPVILLVLIGGALGTLRRELIGDWCGWLVAVVLPPLVLWAATETVVRVFVFRYVVMFIPGMAGLVGASVGLVGAVLGGRRLAAVVSLLLGLALVANNLSELRSSYRSHAPIDSVQPLPPRLIAKVRQGDVILYSANPAAGGMIYGWSLFGHDTQMQKDLLAELPHGQGALLSMRKVVSVHPYRTVKTETTASRTWLVQGTTDDVGQRTKVSACQRQGTFTVSHIPVELLHCP